MNVAELEKLILDSLEDDKAKDVINLDVRELTTITDRMIICSGTSSRHVQTMGEHLVTKAKGKEHQPLGVEGMKVGDWVLVDLNDIVVHIMLPSTREFYSLEKLWTTTERLRQQANES